MLEAFPRPGALKSVRLYFVVPIRRICLLSRYYFEGPSIFAVLKQIYGAGCWEHSRARVLAAARGRPFDHRHPTLHLKLQRFENDWYQDKVLQPRVCAKKAVTGSNGKTKMLTWKNISPLKRAFFLSRGEGVGSRSQPSI